MAPTAARTRPRVLVAIPAYNEEATIASVVAGIREAVPDFDLLVVNDGSRDRTEDILRQQGVTTATHLCNLGYGSAIKTAIKYADRHGYESLVTFDADGQHRPGDIRRVVDAFEAGNFDVLIGSRFVETRRYAGEPGVRRAGMQLFSLLIGVLTRRRIYDTSSGFKAMARRTFGVLTARPFLDFHAEAVVYLMEMGFHVGECQITVDRREHGVSMYTPSTTVKYPVQVCFLLLVGVLEARLTRKPRV